MSVTFPPVKLKPFANEFRTALLGIAANNPFVRYNSPARQQMYTNSHMAQKLPISGMTENFLSTALADALAKSTMGIIMPCDGLVIKILQRYPTTGVGEAISINPETLVIYEEVNTKRMSALVIPTFHSFHPYFGFDLIPTPAAKLIAPGNIIPKDTVLYDSPGRSASGRYMHGVMLFTAHASHPGVAEDGLVISRDVLPALRFKRWERRSVEWGKETIPVNTYGNDTEYKILPDIGEYVRDDGLLCAIRHVDPRTAPVSMSVNGLQRINYNDDNLLYAKGKGGKVVDILVTTNTNENNIAAPYNAQLRKYINARRHFNLQVINTYMEHQNRRKGLQTEENFQEMLVAMMKDVGFSPNGSRTNRFMKTYKKVELNHIRVDVIVEYELEPNIGYKLTECNAAKGVICYIEERENMPRDKYGRSADILMAPESRTNRMNPGGLHEIFYNDAIWHLRKRVLEKLNIPFFEGISLRERNMRCYEREAKAEQLVKARVDVLKNLTDRNLVEGVWDFVINFYRLVSPFQAHLFDRHEVKPWDAILNNIATIVEDACYMIMPPEYAPDYFAIARQVREYVGFERDVVGYAGYSKRHKKTKRPVRIAPMYWMLLEKTADTWSAVSFAKVQQYGFLAQINQNDRYSDPGRPQPIKGAGETEFRIIVSTCGQRAAAEIADRNNSHRTRRALHRILLTHETPGNIPQSIDRNDIPFGGHRAVQILHHYLRCGGLELRYVHEEGS